MPKQIVTFLINILIAGAVILFSLSLSYILYIMIFQLKVTSSAINSTLVSMFVSGVVASLSIGVKSMINKGNDTKGYIFVGKITAIVVVGMVIVRYITNMS